MISEVVIVSINEEGVMCLKNEAYAILDAYNQIELLTKELEAQVSQNYCTENFRKELDNAIDTIRLNLEKTKEPIKYISEMLITVVEAYLEVIGFDSMGNTTKNHN